MAIGEAKATAAVVVEGGDIAPTGRIRLIDENAVIYRIRVFVENNPGLCWFEHCCWLEVLKVLREKIVHALGRVIRRRAKSSEERIHGYAPKPGLPPGCDLAGTEKYI